MSTFGTIRSPRLDLSVLLDATIEVKLVNCNSHYREVMHHLMTVESRTIRPDELKTYHWDFQPLFKAIGTGYILKTDAGDIVKNAGDLRCYLTAIDSGIRSLTTDAYGNRCLKFSSHYSY